MGLLLLQTLITNLHAGLTESKGGFKKAKVASFPRMVARATPEWLVQVMRDMNGAQDLRLIFERTLSASDVKKQQSRLLIPFKKLIRNDFLTPKESLVAAKDEDNNDEDDENIGVGSILVNQRSKKWGLRFKIWKMKKKNSGKGTSIYILNWGWNDVVKGNSLREGDYSSLWSFRCRGELCFALGTG
ncbi:putative B3 domain-containing protein [Cardamine amara subsp. amara]|uniref:B3 domain-containing protein n=1 Tax=Cardamine amara subsp. amara TaxID=228776 RepID=A0ABD1BF78_CARAN